uniref:Uncharacterized protein n=1 Tax=Naja naja TaxID=35670 RepID=A0A8C6XLV1_NAJNA
MEPHSHSLSAAGPLPPNQIPTGGIYAFWLTDWKVILGYVPWINGKFKEDE